MSMKFEKQPSKFIKPSIPTPPNLKHYKIGFIDELAAGIDVAIVLFFTKNNNHNPKFLSQLENSLEETLTCLYPLAGRYVEESQTVECNDKGVDFIQAKVNIKLEEFLDLEDNVNSVDEFIPFRTKTHDVVLRIQLTTFQCGAIALAVSATHRVADASTLCTFLNEWAAMNRGENEINSMRSSFNSSSLFPSRGIRPVQVPLTTADETLRKCTRNKLSFSECAISNMKVKAITSGKSGGRHLSKVQLVSSIIWKALIDVDRVTHGFTRESVLFQPINLREKMASPIPKNACGNLCGVCVTKPTILETTEELANLLHGSIRKDVNDYAKVHHNSEQAQTMVLKSFLNMANIPESTNAIFLTSWCKFPFYDVDIGFGKPVWVVPGTIPLKKVPNLIDGMGGNGIDAYIYLEVKDVPYFEQAIDINVFGA